MANGHMSVCEIGEIIGQIKKDPAYRISPADARRVVYNATWKDIMEAAKRADVASSYSPASDAQAALEALKLDSEPFKNLGISYKTKLQNEDGSNLELKKMAFDEICELLKDSIEAYIVFGDLDLLHGSRPNASPVESEFLKGYMKKFSESVITAIQNKTTIHTFIEKIDETTKANIANAWLIGLKPHPYTMGSTRVAKSNLFISRHACTDFKKFIEELGKKQDRKTRDVQVEIANGIGISVDELEEIIEERRVPSIPLLESVQAYLTRFADEIRDSPNLLQQRTVMLYYRELSEKDVQENVVIEGVPEVRYKSGRVAFTNFLPLVKAVEAECKEYDTSKPAWRNDWGQHPSVDAELLNHLDDVIAATAIGKIYSREKGN